MLTDANLTGEAREAYMEAIAKKSVNLTEDERMAFADALMRESVQATEAKQNRTYSQRGDDYLIEAQKVCAEDKPKPPVMCPYCGHKMAHQYVYGDHFFRCHKCRAVAPDKDTEAEAYTAAMQRWQEPNRVLTMEEVEDACELDNETVLLWVEFNCNGVCTLAYQYCTMGEAIATVYMIRPYDEVETDFSKMDYRKKWRCWLRKPTKEEMEAVLWGDD